MKFELSKPVDYSNATLLDEIRRVARLVEKPISKTKFDQNSKYSASTIARHFGGWLAALQKAGLDETYWHTESQEIIKEKITDELKRISELLGTKTFSAKDFETYSHIDRNIFSRKFGSFGKAMKEVGFSVPLSSRKYTDEERFENLLNVWTHYGRQPNYAEMKKDPSAVGPKAYVTRWGSWRKALLAFVDRVNSDLLETESSNTSMSNSSQPKVKKIPPEDRREIPLGLRYDILKRDKFCCVLCGAVPKTHNVSLEVDHVIPWTKGGKTMRDNLRTLCNKCNNGKSDKIE